MFIIVFNSLIDIYLRFNSTYAIITLPSSYRYIPFDLYKN